MTYGFINPLDLTLMSYPTLDAALERARSYLGQKGAYGEAIESVDILAIQSAGEVKVDGPEADE